VTSSKRSDEVAQLQENLTTTSDALMHTGKHNEELLATLDTALKANLRMSECIVGQHSLELAGTVGIKLQEASTSGLGGEDVSTGMPASQVGRLFYVESIVEGGAAHLSHR